MASLAEQLSELTNPAPLSVDPEDDIYEETKARLVDKNDLPESTTDPETSFNIGRKQMLSLEGMGSAYQGKVVSREAASEDGSLSEEQDALENDEDDDVTENISDDDNDDNRKLEAESSDEVSEVENYDGMDEEIDSDEAVGDDINIRSARSDVDSHTKQTSTRNQICLWESMLESRIKCQKMLAITNQLPQHDKIALFKDQVGNSCEDTAKILTELLARWSELEGELLKQNSRYSSFSKMENRSKKRKMKSSLEEWDEAVDERFCHMRTHRNELLKLWYNKTRLNNIASSKFSSFERSTVTQIEDILKDQERLIKRTQLKRSSYRPLGTTEEDMDKNSQAESVDHSSHLKEFNGEIFDDDDFYHQLLRQLIEQKASAAGGASDPVELTRQWLKIQRSRNSTRKNVDTKASKGRKIRYEIHKKLVSFMAPDDRSTFTDEARNSLFQSLFGKIPSADV